MFTTYVDICLHLVFIPHVLLHDVSEEDLEEEQEEVPMVEADHITAEERRNLEEKAFTRSTVVHEGKIVDCKFSLMHPQRGFPIVGTYGERDPAWGREKNRPRELAVGMMLALSRNCAEDKYPLDVAEIKRVFMDEHEHVWARIQWWEPYQRWGNYYRKTPGSLDNIALSGCPI